MKVLCECFLKCTTDRAIQTQSQQHQEENQRPERRSRKCRNSFWVNNEDEARTYDQTGNDVSNRASVRRSLLWEGRQGIVKVRNANYIKKAYYYVFVFPAAGMPKVLHLQVYT